MHYVYATVEQLILCNTTNYRIDTANYLCAFLIFYYIEICLAYNICYLDQHLNYTLTQTAPMRNYKCIWYTFNGLGTIRITL